MHNGVLAGWGSDVQELALLREDPGLIHRASLWEWLEKETKGSRLLFCGTSGPNKLACHQPW